MLENIIKYLGVNNIKSYISHRHYINSRHYINHKFNNRLTKNKRALTFNLLKYTFFTLLFLAVVFTSIWMFTASQITLETDVDDIANVILTKRILASNLVAGKDTVLDRNNIGIVKAEIFDAEDGVLEDMFELENTNLAARLELTDIKTGDKKPTFVNGKWYRRYSPLAVKKFENQFDKDIVTRYVLIKEDGELRPGILKIDYIRAS